MARRYEATPERQGELFSTISGVENEPLYSPENVELDYERDLGWPGAYPVHARRLPVDVPRPALDDAPVRRLRHGGGDERALPLPARARPDGPLDGVRHADADGLRLRPSALARRGRARGRRDRLARRHGDALRRDPARRGLDLDDDQRPGGDAARVLRLRRRGAGRPARAAARHRPDGHPQGVHRAEGVDLPARSRRCGSSSTWSSGAPSSMPLMHPVSISGYHIREAGSNAAQELAFTLSNGFALVEACIERGLDVDAFAPRLSFFFNAHLDFFEEIAKYRAARRIWARRCASKYGAKDPRSWLMRFHTQTAGVSLTAQQPEVNLDPHRDRGAGGGARRDAVAAHELVRRGARAADRARGAARAAHAAGDRARDRRREHDRPARRLVLPRAADERARAAGVRLLRADRGARRRHPGDRAELPAARDRRGELPLPVRGRARRARRRRRQPLRSSRTSSRSSSSASTRRSSRSRSSACRRCARGATRRRPRLRSRG